MKGWMLGVTVLTFVVLTLGLFIGGVMLAVELARTNQMIHLLGALFCWAGAALYGRCLFKTLDM